MDPYDYQERSIQHLLKVLPSGGAAVDGSDTGTGKTLVAVEVMRRLDLPTLVVCPKAVVPGWKRTAAAQGTDLDALNYEMLRTGRTPYGEWRGPDLRHRDEWFRWHPEIKLLLIDEAHRCKGYQTKNSLLLKSARQQGILTLAMSATIADSPMEMDALGYLLRFHDSDSPPTLRNPSPYSFYRWATEHGCGGTPLAFHGGPAEMARINAAMYPAKGVRVKIEDLGDQFPETQITAELYELDEPGRLDALYAEMAEARAQLHKRTQFYSADPMSVIMKARQEVELLKVPVIVSQTQDDIAQGASVAIFVNFRLTLQEICRRLGTDCFIDGSQVGEKGAQRREANRLRFQRDESRVIVGVSEAAGIGLDLHDVTGKHWRSSKICPGYNAKVLKQVFGRVRRAGGKSKSIQRIILAGGTIEENVYANFTRKSNCLDALNDGDLDPSGISFGPG